MSNFWYNFQLVEGGQWLVEEVKMKLLNILHRCLSDADDDCKPPDLSRRRRGISSDVVNNVIVTTKPMNNVILMMEEIFGDKDM